MISIGANLGLAGGLNIAMRYALKEGFQYLWLLNNDTTAKPDAMQALVAKMQSDPSIGMCGSTLVDYAEPTKVQAYGGARYDFERGIGHHLGAGSAANELPSAESIEKEMDYVVGASMMVSKAFVEEVGLMSEDYFLYYEELDWAVRSRGRFRLGWAPDSVVAHKLGGSIGSSHGGRPSAASLTYIGRNRLKFATRYTPKCFWKVWRRMAFEFLVYVKRGDLEAAWITAASLARALMVRLS